MSIKNASPRIIGVAMRTFLQNAQEMVFIKDLNYVYVGASKAFSDLVGYDCPEKLVGKSDFEIFDNEELAKRYRYDDEILLASGKSLVEYIEPIPSSDGSSRYCATSKYIIKDDDGTPVGMMGISRDITREYEAKRNYERELSYLFELPKDALFAVLLDITAWRVVDCRFRKQNDKVVSMFDTIESFAENAIKSVVSDDTVRQFFAEFNQENVNEIFASGKRNIALEYMRSFSDGSVIWVNETFHFLMDPVSGHLSILTVIKDVDKEKRAQKAMRHAAERDSLTGLLNRAAIVKKITKFIKKPGFKGMHALLMIDIDNFKKINDTYGHQCGDKALCIIADTMRAEFRDTDFLGRLGGDEFFVFVKNVGHADIVMSKARGLLKAINQSDLLDCCSYVLSCSVGISFYNGDGKSMEQLYAEADTSLYRAKTQGKNRYSVFEDSPLETCSVFNRPVIGDFADAYTQMGCRIMDNDYEIVCLIDTQADTILCQKVLDDKVYYPLHLDERYSSQVAVFAEKVIGRSDRKDYINNMSIDTIIETLRVKGKHGFYYPMNLPCGNKAYKKWNFMWLNNDHRAVILTRRDSSRLAEAEIDPLTGLFNRPAFCRHVRDKLMDDPNTQYCIVRWDIDRFKIFNDMFGTEAGDQILKKMSSSLICDREHSRILGHFQSDHFVALVPFTGEVDSLHQLVEGELKNGIDHSGFKLSVSIGLYVVVDRTLDVSLMCDRALMALRTVKNNYTEKVATYHESMRDSIMDEQALCDGFDQAILESQFLIYFQPQINYESKAMIGAEALVRWQHPTRGLIYPDQFISLFEKKGFITRLDEYVWDKSCQYIRKWLDAGLPKVTISVNISRVDIYSTELCATLQNMVEKYRLPLSSLKLEITESAYMEDAQQLIDAVKALRQAGFIVAMDDFGAGFSSLNMLKDVPVDVLKLDVRFLSRSEEESRGGKILSSVLRMAQWLKLPVIAEGVENKIDADYLKNLGCILMQGYHFARPMTAEAFESYLSGKTMGAININDSASIDGISVFWDVSAQMTLLFNEFIGAAAIVEYHNSEIELVRANDKFYDEIGTTREQYAPHQMRMLERFDPKSRALYIKALNESIASGIEITRELCGYPLEPGGDYVYTLCRVKVLVKNLDRYLFFVSIENMGKPQLCRA